MQVDNYMSNLGVHARWDATALMRDDMYRLLTDLDDLDKGLHCAECGDPVWKELRGEDHHCKCGKLTA